MTEKKGGDKKNKKIFKKTIDELKKVWYNMSVVRKDYKKSIVHWTLKEVHFMNRTRAFYNIISNSLDVTDFTHFNTVKQTINSLESLILQLDPNAVFTHKTTADKTKVWGVVVHEENNKEYGIITILSREGYNISII